MVLMLPEKGTPTTARRTQRPNIRDRAGGEFTDWMKGKSIQKDQRVVFHVTEIWVQIPALLLPSYVTLGKECNHPVCQLPVKRKIPTFTSSQGYEVTARSPGPGTQYSAQRKMDMNPLHISRDPTPSSVSPVLYGDTRLTLSQ